LINGNFDLPAKNIAAMKQVREIVAECAQKLTEAVTEVSRHYGVGYDTGRLIAALDLLQQVKDTACVSLILPFGPN